MIDIRPLVPDSLASHREAIGDAFEFFRKATSTSAENATTVSLSEGASFERWISIALASPSLHKLAQVLARHRSLPLELRRQLQTLESLAPRTPIDPLLPMIREDLGSSFSEIELEATALAEASVAVVIPFLRRSSGDEPIRGVLKVLRPGIRARLERELQVWPEVGEVFGRRCRRDGLPDVDYRGPFETVAHLLRNEVNFEAEQQHLGEADSMLSVHPGVRVPKLLPFCSARITAMERIDGKKATETESLTADARRRLAARIVEALLAAPMFSPQQDAMFHADPHAGNLVATPSGDLAILDWALVGHLSQRNREQLAQVMLSAQLLDAGGVCRAIERLGESSTPDAVRLRETVERSFAEMKSRSSPGFTWLTELLDAAALTCGVRFGENLLLFRKTLLILQGVIADVSSEGSLDELLMSSTFNQLSREWPGRFLLPFASRGVGSRLSNFDLLRASWLLPWVSAARWRP